MRRLVTAAQSEHRTPDELATAIVQQRLAAREAARSLITVVSAPELEGTTPGILIRSEGESDERYAVRAALFAELFAIADET
jgi:hypothetical protein